MNLYFLNAKCRVQEMAKGIPVGATECTTGCPCAKNTRNC